MQRTVLAFGAIYEQEGLELSDEEVEQEFKARAFRSPIAQLLMAQTAAERLMRCVAGSAWAACPGPVHGWHLQVASADFERQGQEFDKDRLIEQITETLKVWLLRVCWQSWHALQSIDGMPICLRCNNELQ